MLRYLSLLLLLCLISIEASTQEQPPVNFPGGKKVCDPSPYRLVFDDEFNGDTLDYSKWRTWGTFLGKEDDNWGMGRWDWAGHSIMRDENVVVGDGIAKLQIWHGPQYWKCTDIQNPDACPMHRQNYSNAWLTTKYSEYYNSGRFQVRLKFPKSDYTWNTIWLYHGDGINEIDIAESHGGPWFPYGPFGHTNNYNVSYSLHAQPPPWYRPANPHNLKDDEVVNHYPHQKWWDKVRGTYFDLNNWHVYTCEWDTALIATYLDGILMNQVPKYYYMECLPRYKSFLFFSWKAACINTYHPAICATDPSKTYHITRGFPYNNNSKSQLRITTGMSADETPFDQFTLQYTDSSRYLKSEMAVDYVRIWQRHPEADNHTTLCDLPIPNVSGPSNVCSTALYQVDPTLSGTWTASGLRIISSSPNSVTVTPQNGNNGFGRVVFHFQPPGCIADSTVRYVDVGAPENLFFANVVRSTFFGSSFGQNNRSNFSCAYNLFVSNDQLGAPAGPTTYHWDVWYGPDYSNHFTADGAYTTTPGSRFVSGSYGGIRGTLSIRNSCGTRVINIDKSNDQQKSSGDEPEFDTISKVNYYCAHIPDTTAFIEDVERQIQHQFFPDTALDKANAVEQLIQQSIVEALGNYIIPPGGRSAPNAKPLVKSGSEIKSVLYPNPASSSINISASENFRPNSPLDIDVADVYGRRLASYQVRYTNGMPIEISIKNLPKGIYSILITQEGEKEYLRFIKE